MSFLSDLTAQLPFGNKDENPEYFFVLNIGLSQVLAAIWSVYKHDIDILDQVALPYDGSEDLFNKAHQALDQALGVLEIEPEKILFGVPDNWSVDDNLKEPYLKLLKRMLKEYNLSPMAYVTDTSALSHLLQKGEGISPTVILLGVGDYIEASLLRGGKVSESRMTKRGDQLFDDLEKVIRQFTDVEVLPSKILLYSTKKDEDLEKIQASLMSYPWMQKLSFLHFPKIDILDENILTSAIVFAGAVEIDPEVHIKSNFSKETKPGLPKRLAQEPLGDFTKTSEAGFIKGDIKQQVSEKELLEEDNKEAEMTEDFKGEKPVSNYEEEDLESDSLISTTSQRNLLVHREDENKGFSLPKRNLMKVFRFKKVFLQKILILPVVLMLLLGAYLFFFKASVTVFIEPKILEKEAEVVADPTVKAIDEEKKIIPGSSVETTVSGSGKSSASGKKEIGDPAKGKVVIYNLTNSRLSFSQSTVLKSADNLKFTLSSSVQIASQSSSLGADLTTIIKPGKSEAVEVVADNIGPEGNLSAGSELTIGSYQKSQALARVDDAFSGGTSKTVTVVTSDDQKKLQAKVLDELRQRAVDELQEKLAGEKKIISEALEVAESNYNFSKQVNDVASEFSLSARLRFKGTSYLESDLRTIVSKLVETNVPEGFQLNIQDAETQADIMKVEKNGKLVFKAKFKAKLFPKVDLDELKKEVRGRSVEEVANYLRGLEGVMGSEIKITPNLPLSFIRLPLWEKNIDVTITPK